MIIKRTRALSPIFLLSSVLLGACASGGTSSGTDVQRDPNRISPEELQAQPPGTAYEAIERLRPNWLRARSTSLSGGVGGSVNLPRVFVDDRDFGTMASLRNFHLDSVEEILYMSARDATTRYGTGYAGGIIHLRLKRRPQ
jgi:predicted small secreted protein